MKKVISAIAMGILTVASLNTQAASHNAGFPITTEFRKAVLDKTQITISHDGTGYKTDFKNAPLRIPSELNFDKTISAQQAQKLLNYPLYDYTSVADKKKLNTCKEWFDEGSYGPENDSIVSAALIRDVVTRKCKALTILSEASPAKKSFIPAKGIAQLDLIPETWRPEAVLVHGGEFKYDAKAPKVSSPSEVIIESYALDTKGKAAENPSILRFTEYARGDFDADGIEDILLLAYSKANGTWKAGWLMVATRYSNQSTYVDISNKITSISHDGPETRF